MTMSTVRSRRVLRAIATGAAALLLAVLGGAVAAAPALAADAPPAYEVSAQLILPGGDSGVAVDPARDLVYVARRFSGHVYVRDGADLTAVRTIAVPNQPYNLAVGPTGVLYASQYTGNNTQGSLAVVLPGAIAPALTLPVGKSPVGVTLSPDGKTLYVANLSDRFISVFDITTPGTPVAAGQIATPTFFSETITPSADGSRLFVADNNSAVHLIDIAAQTTTTWSMGGNSSPHQVGLLADGNRAIVSAQQLTTTPLIDTATGAIGSTLPLANTYFQSDDPGLNAMFVTVPFSGAVGVVDRTTGALAQTLGGIPRPYYIATNPVTHASYVTTLAGNQLTKITPVAPPVEAVDPTHQTVQEGQTATFTAGITSGTPDSVRWERRADAGAAWEPIPGTTAASYTTPATALADSGSQYRAIFSVAGQEITTGPATLTVLEDAGAGADQDANAGSGQDANRGAGADASAAANAGAGVDANAGANASSGANADVASGARADSSAAVDGGAGGGSNGAKPGLAVTGAASDGSVWILGALLLAGCAVLFLSRARRNRVAR